MVAVLLAALPAFRGIWRGGDALARAEQLWRRIWPYSESALHGWLRAQVAIYLGGWFLAVAYPTSILLRTSDATIRPTVRLFFWATVIGFLAMVALTITIVLFNQPQRLALPQLRDQEGLLTRWWRRRRNHSPE